MAIRLSVEIPDEAYWKRQINCQDTCPVHTDARGYVRAIAQGEYEQSYRIARGPNPLASICSRVCGAPCEVACRRGAIDAPIAIRALKRFVCEQYGAETIPERPLALIDRVRELPSPDADIDELGHIDRALQAKTISPAPQQKVAIIGSGPAGLACAHDLALLGLTPVVFEMESVPAGLLHLGVPEYRLPRDIIRAEVAVIEALGVEIRCGVQIGKDVTFSELRRDYAAVVIAAGAKRSRWLKIPGADAKGILGGVDFLRAVSLGIPMPLGDKVVVIGGGNVAYDVSRTVVRQESWDVSRQVRRAGVREVNLCSLESLEEMPAEDVEILEGDQEGIIRHNSLGPVEFLKDETGHVNGVVFQKCLSVYDQQQRFAPVFDPAAKTTFIVDTVLLSVGQAPDLTFLDPEKDGVELGAGGWIKCDPETLATAAEGVFVAGDLAYGTKLLIHAEASGKKAARSVYHYLTGKTIRTEILQTHQDLGDYRRERGYEGIPRIDIPTEDIAKRLADPRTSVEKGYDEALAQQEASRCLDCGINTIFDGERCVLCGGCVDVCPTLCLKLVPVKDLNLTPEQREAAAASMGEGWEESSIIIKDEETCIRCALCAQRCPTNTITMERMSFAEVWT